MWERGRVEYDREGEWVLLLGRRRRVAGDVDGADAGVGCLEVGTGDVEGVVRVGANAEEELALAVAIAGVAVPGEAHGHGVVAGEGNEAEAVGDELVVEDGGVDLNLHRQPFLTFPSLLVASLRSRDGRSSDV